jgi:hypothetical protein
LTFDYHEEIQCIYKNVCINYGKKCCNCFNNTGRRDYYQPAQPYPNYPWYLPSWIGTDEFYTVTCSVTKNSTTKDNFYKKRD